jgi:hypothetical protein
MRFKIKINIDFEVSENTENWPVEYNTKDKIIDYYRTKFTAEEIMEIGCNSADKLNTEITD